MKQVDWNKEEAKAKTMSISALLYTAKDCREAERAMRSHNPEAEGYYADVASVYERELRRRRA